ncbi:hypothetical protein D0C36_04245 [Mucilaginibacter conchicola]|uniref:Alpha/beta hydrolase n=1 Tax=Mucilaginibacter conchicola TaxID=2303333 RepID=A0A372NXX8_9SPHI|nr:hypothetical protein [Mucilaginibacter conchicola]RFZ94754.1 hypothetical protein D0C36_04245 [Mucilaginibacter conchicola]
MKKYLLSACILLVAACSKNNGNDPGKPQQADGVSQKTETANGITYKVFTANGQSQYKGVLVVGSGNDENNPTPGSLEGGAETDLCQTAAKNGYVAAIVQYRKTAGNADWNNSAAQIAQDYDKCIVALAGKYGVDKSKSAVAGFSYASFMLLTDITVNNTLSYSKGVLAACGGADTWKAQHFKIPVFSINCAGNNEGDFNGKALYDQIPANSPVKARSGGVTDNSCNTHCGGTWTQAMMGQLKTWLE